MAWTPADAETIRGAILKLALGERDVTISYGGPPARTRTFQTVELDDLRALLAEVQREVGGGATYRLGATRKGLGA
jgi:hypothetical protein